MKKGKDDMINLYSTERLAEVLSGIVFRHECNTFIELRERYGKNYIIILGVLPYLALFSVEAQLYFESIGVPIDIQNQLGYEAKDVRIIIKQFNERFGKARKKVISVENRREIKRNQIVLESLFKDSI